MNLISSVYMCACVVYGVTGKRHRQRGNLKSLQIPTCNVHGTAERCSKDHHIIDNHDWKFGKNSNLNGSYSHFIFGIASSIRLTREMLKQIIWKK